jgi:hypothetical protein
MSSRGTSSVNKVLGLAVETSWEKRDPLTPLMDFCCGHSGAKSYAKKKNIARSPGLIFPGIEKRKNKMYLEKPTF